MFYVGLALLLASVNVLAQLGFKYRCDQMPKAIIDYKTIVELNPYYIYRTMVPIHYCAQIIYIMSEGQRNYDKGTAIVIQGNSTFSYRMDIYNNTLSHAVLCTTGRMFVYQTVYYNFDSHNASYCVVNCADDGINFNDVTCLGRTPEDEAHIQKFIDTNLQGVQGIRDNQSGCKKPKNCDFVIN